MAVASHTVRDTRILFSAGRLLPLCRRTRGFPVTSGANNNDLKEDSVDKYPSSSLIFVPFPAVIPIAPHH